MNVGIIGSGGRENSICFSLKKSKRVDKIFCMPGNAGTANISKNLEIDINNFQQVKDAVNKYKIDLLVVGPEKPLVDGIVDFFNNTDVKVFGPNKKASQLEGSKIFTKKLCQKYNIPTAKFGIFQNAIESKKFIDNSSFPIVIKADGLASGKGVYISENTEKAYQAIDEIFNGKFGEAKNILIEEFLTGEEMSYFIVTDGSSIKPFETAQDHKRVGDGDTGLNTGGMGAYSPAPVVTKEIEEDVMKNIIEPTVRGMREEGCEYNGVIFAGLMIDEKTKKVKLLEHNVRFGDPECQTLMARMESDLCQLLYAAATNNITDDDVKSVKWSKEPAVNVVLAAKGYPGSYSKGDEIKNLQGAEESTAKTKIFHAGTASGENGEILANGGRVLGITAMGTSVKEATKNAYVAIDKIDWPNGFCRSDIAYRAIEREEGRGK